MRLLRPCELTVSVEISPDYGPGQGVGGGGEHGDEEVGGDVGGEVPLALTWPGLHQDCPPLRPHRTVFGPW